MKQAQVREANDLNHWFLHVENANTEDYPAEHVLEKVERVELVVGSHMVVKAAEHFLEPGIL